MKPSQALHANRDKVLEILSRYPVKNPMVFGSVARGDDTEESDIDILVEHDGTLSLIDLVGLEEELVGLTGARVEVHTPGQFKHASLARIRRDLRVF